MTEETFGFIIQKIAGELSSYPYVQLRGRELVISCGGEKRGGLFYDDGPTFSHYWEGEADRKSYGTWAWSDFQAKLDAYYADAPQVLPQTISDL